MGQQLVLWGVAFCAWDHRVRGITGCERMYSLVNNISALLTKMSEKDMSFGVFGCDNAGKTTLIRSFCGEKYDPELGPTFGMKSYMHKDGTHNIKLLDLGGGKKFRNFWKSNYPEMHGMIFVIDSACPDRFDESGEALFEMLKDPLVKDKPILIFANKQDLPSALAQGEVAKRMQLNEKEWAKKWQIQDCVALTKPDEKLDTRVQQGMDWLCTAIVRDFDRLDARVTQDVSAAKDQEKNDRENAKEARRKRKEARERKQAEEEAQAAEAAMQAAEQAEVAVPMKIQVDRANVDADTNMQPAVTPAKAGHNAAPDMRSGSPTSAPASLPPLRSVPKAKASPQDLVVSGSPLPQDSSSVVDPNVPVSPVNKTLHSV